MCVCMCVLSIVATPFNLQLRNFGNKFFWGLSKMVSQIYEILAASPRRRGVQSLRNCGSAYLIKLENSRIATVTSQQSLRDCDYIFNKMG